MTQLFVGSAAPVPYTIIKIRQDNTDTADGRRDRQPVEKILKNLKKPLDNLNQIG